MDQEPKPADIRFLPTNGLEVPDWNPRKTMSEPGLAALEAYVKAGGTIPRIWVWGGDGKSVISGQRRLTVYRRLGKPLIEAEILHVSLEEAQRLARSSNRGDALNWLEEYESWEGYFQPGSKLTDEAIGALEGVDSTWVRRARALLVVLNPASRKLIREHLAENSSDDPIKNKGNNDIPESFRNVKKPLKKRISKNEEKWALSEGVAFPLTSLWNKRSIQEAQALVEKCLPVILSREMKGPKVKALVKWVSAGNNPEEFGKLGVRSEGFGKLGMKSEELGVKTPTSKRPGEEAYSGTGSTGSPQAGVASPSTPAYSAGTPRNDSGNDDVVKRKAHANSPIEPAHPKQGSRLVAFAQGWWPEVKSFLLRQFKRVLGHEVRRWIVSGLGVLVVIFLLSPHLYLSLYHLATGYLGGRNVTISSPLPAQAGRQALAVPNRSADGNGGTQAGSAPLSSRPVGQPPLPPINSSGAQAPNLSRSAALQPPIPPIGSSGAPAKPASTQNGDLLNQIGTGVKNYQSAVNTADQAKSATDRAKGLLGF